MRPSLSLRLCLSLSWEPGDRFTKREHMIPMRDGVKLYVAVYTPKTQALAAEPPAPMPMLMSRTPCLPHSISRWSTDRFSIVGSLCCCGCRSR